MNLFKKYNLYIVQVDRLATHGGSIRVYVGNKIPSLTEKKRLSQKQIDQAYTRREGIFEFFSINKNKQSLYSDALKKNELQKYCAGSTSEMFADQILGLIEAGKCDWSEIQRVFGWGAVSELSSREC